MTSHGEYARVVRRALPAEAFRRQPMLLWYFAGHAVIVLACVVASRYVPVWGVALLGLFAGHSAACIAFFAHELSHNAILRRGRLRSAMESIAWGINVIPATLWAEVHNRSHHCHTNTPLDPDRKWVESERHAGTTVYTALLYPSRVWRVFNPLVLVQFPGYISRNIISALSGGHFGMLPAHPAYTGKQRMRILFEVLAILALQIGCLAWLGWSVLAWAVFFAVYVGTASAIVMMYVFTNHYLNEIVDENDPVASSTSVAVPRWVDRLHLYFSYHTEHHLFPSIDHRYMPEVSRLLAEQFPEQYTRIPILTAWRGLLTRNLFERDAVSLERRGPIGHGEAQAAAAQGDLLRETKPPMPRVGRGVGAGSVDGGRDV